MSVGRSDCEGMDWPLFLWCRWRWSR